MFDETTKLVIIGVILLSIIGTITGVYVHIKSLDATITSLTAKNSLLTEANATDEANIKTSNDAVTALQNQALSQSKAASVAIAAAKKDAQTKQAQITTLMAQKSTGNVAQDCDLLNSNLNNLIGGK